MSAFEQLQEAIADTLNIEASDVSQSSNADNLPAWDSLGHVNLMVALEETFDIELDVEDFPKLTSVQAILDHLKGEGIE